MAFANHYDLSAFPDAFFTRIKNNGYTHILADVEIAKSSRYDTNRVREVARDAFLRAESFGLRLVPRLQTGSAWAGGWRKVNPAIQMNAFLSRGDTLGAPSFAAFTHNRIAYDTAMERSFGDYLSALKRGLDQAVDSGLSYDRLDYLSIGGDEPVDGNVLLVGHGGSTRTLSHSTADRNFIRDNLAGPFANDTDRAFQGLLVRGIYEKSRQIRRVFGAGTKIIVDGDMWDPHANGGARKQTYMTRAGGRPDSVRLAPSSRPYTGIAALPGLSRAEKAALRRVLVIAPWNYFPSWPSCGKRDCTRPYDANATFDYLARSGLKILYWSNVAGDRELQPDRLQAMREYVSAARLHKTQVLGYIAGYWNETGDPGCGFYKAPSYACYKTLEYLPRINALRRPTDSL